MEFVDYKPLNPYILFIKMDLSELLTGLCACILTGPTTYRSGILCGHQMDC
uniref:Uncharacterized protein n=1 Tax=Arundo donax TaxID=35708 RepID=A0A0A9CK21_ARUDO